jgi:hypothetical protein
VRYDFPFEQVSERFETPILNEVGTRDVWPAIAESVTWGYGSAGTYGFRRPRVRDRWHNGKNHSAFLEAEFCRKFWTPFLSDGTVVEGSLEPEYPPWWTRLLYIFQIKYVALACASILIGNIFVKSWWLPQYPEPAFPVAGIWDIEMICPKGAKMLEPNAEFIKGRYARKFLIDGAKSSTELVMGYEPEDGISVLGRVIFGEAIVYDVKAKGVRMGSVYSGIGSFGPNANCVLTAKKS